MRDGGRFVPEAAGADPRVTAQPAVSIVVPFYGSREDAEDLIRVLLQMELGPSDELIVSDNTPAGVAAEAGEGTAVMVVPSRLERSSYHTRNVGAKHARRRWILFIDSDTRPRRDLIAEYFREPIPGSIGAVAGPMLARRVGEGIFARYAESRCLNEQAFHVSHTYRPFGATGNLLVRAEAFAEVGGFQEGIRSGGDADFCWRLAEVGWGTGYREGAYVHHLLRERIRAYLRVHARYGSGRNWVQKRWPEADMGAHVGRIFRYAAGCPYWWLRGQFDRGVFKGIDVAVVLAEGIGYLFGNRPPNADGQPSESDRCEIAVMADSFPELPQTFVVNEVRAIQRAGRRVSVEARSRPLRPAFGAVWGLDVHYGGEVGSVRQLGALLWLLARHPLRSVADLLARRRWRREEKVSPLRVLAPTARRMHRRRVEHLHAHFARRAALDALRLHRLLGIPYSVTAHAWDIYKEPTNLEEKLSRASFVTTGCDYNVRHLRRMLGEPAGSRVYEIVMGVDQREFRRSRPYDGNGTIAAVGRLQEKKGFEHLVIATARIEAGLLRRVLIVGEGRMRERLLEVAREHGVADRVELLGAREPAEVRELLDGVALLAMPCVVAADGDRDSMPVVVKEAMAMGVPVVASDEVGLPETVREGWGRLVPPADPEALAGAIRELLELPVSERRRMGERGRDQVSRAADVDAETARLLALIDLSRGRASVAEPGRPACFDAFDEP